MVEILPLPLGDQQVIQGYGRGGFRVSDQDWRGGVLVMPGRTLPWPVATLAEMDIAAFDPVRDASPAVELLLIGTGQRMSLLPAALRAALRAFGFGIETMDTGAACRTYNVLIGEERRVAAALLPVG